MKKFLLVIFTLLSTVILVSCRDSVSSNDDKGNDIITQQYFLGEVVEIYNSSCLIKISDAGNQNHQFKVGDEVVVSTNVENCPEYVVGDYLRIIFDGTIAESYPPQILTVYAIHKTDSLGANID